MPWKDNSELPDPVQSALPTAAQTRFRTVANAALASGSTDSSAIRQAWSVVLRGWKKPKDGGKWVRKADNHTLYVCRYVENADDIIAWAKEQGFKTTLKPEDMHVTIAFSRDKVDWEELEEQDTKLRITKRAVEALGDKGAVVLRFTSPKLTERWNEFKDAGASWDWEGYKPHITLTYDPGDVDLADVEPYSGTIVLGPEVFNEVDDEWADKLVEKRGLSLSQVEKLMTTKRGARHTRAEFAQLQTIHDHAVSLGATCPGMEDLPLDDDPSGSMLDAAGAVQGRIAKVDESLGLVFGWAIVCKIAGKEYFDTQGDHIPEDTMLKAAAEFMENDRVHKVMHEGDQVGNVVFAFPMTAEVAKAFKLKTKQTGLMIAIKPNDNDVLQKFHDGTYTGFSIGGDRVVDKEVS